MIASPIDVIRAHAPAHEGERILDIGCGGGDLAAALCNDGAQVTGIDPGEVAIARARVVAPMASFHVAGAERLPVGIGPFDLVTMVNALHHVEVALMGVAIEEARRVLKVSGQMVIVEPEARGSFFEALRLIEDETKVRIQAQLAIKAAIDNGSWRLVQQGNYTRAERFTSPSQFIARVVAVDPSRQATVDANRTQVEAAILEAAEKRAGLLCFDQPNIFHILSPRT